MGVLPGESDFQEFKIQIIEKFASVDSQNMKKD